MLHLLKKLVGTEVYATMLVLSRIDLNYIKQNLSLWRKNFRKGKFQLPIDCVAYKVRLGILTQDHDFLFVSFFFR